MKVVRNRLRGLRGRIVALVLACFAVVAVAGTLAIGRAEPMLRARVIETLSARFKSRVELDAFHVSVFPRLNVSGKGLRIFGETDPNSHQPGIQPLIGVAEFRFRSDIWGLFRAPMHVRTVYLRGLQLNLPPKEQRTEMTRMEPKGEKIEIVIHSLVADTAELVINTEKPGKLPLEFAIERLKMTSIGPQQPMDFEADLINPKPVGRIHSRGSFGPWQAESPRDTPVQGQYAFRDADLSTIKGIGGILSSTGNYSGTLDHIVVDGTTDTPDFHIATRGRPVALHTDFHAIVDGTSGDTYLQPVRAKLQDSWLTANGSVVRSKEPPGHHVKLAVEIKQGKIEDLLKLAVRTDPPIMTGAVELKTDFDLPPGETDLANRLKLAGTFQIVAVHFTNAGIQAKVDSLSMRSQGKPKLAQDNIPDNVHSDLSGSFCLSRGLISFSELQFQVPGAVIDLAGRYSLDGTQVDFHGKARIDAKLSQMVTGWKSILLKPVDPFFHKDGAGTEIPVKVTGTKSDLHFGTDFGHKSSSRD